MILSAIERHLLINQYEILQRLDPCNHYDLLLSMLYSGFDTDFIKLLTRFDKPPLSEEVQQEVRDIIQMFRALGTANETPAVNFKGFSSDDEPEHYRYVMFVLAMEVDLIPVSRFDYNTPFPMLPVYRAMLKEWRASCNPENLTDDDVRRIDAKASLGFPWEKAS